MKVLQIGPYPHPSGGVSVHIKRMTQYLETQGIHWHVFDTINITEEALPHVERVASKAKRFIQYFFQCNDDIVHIHSRSWRDRSALIFIAKFRGARSVLTLHSFRDKPNKMKWWNRWFLKYTLKNADAIIATGKLEREKVLAVIPSRENLFMIPAFIPPQKSDEGTALPEEVKRFLSQYPQIVCANGSNMKHFEGIDTYGLDHFVQLCGALKDRPEVGFIYCLSRETDSKYMNEIMAKIEQLGVENKIMIYKDHVDFWKVIAESTVLVRPTATDSYGVSVAEAVCQGVPAIASDVCIRPEGTVLFEKRNLEELIHLTKDVLNHNIKYREKLNVIQFPNYAQEVVEIYNILLKH